MAMWFLATKRLLHVSFVFSNTGEFVPRRDAVLGWAEPDTDASDAEDPASPCNVNMEESFPSLRHLAPSKEQRVPEQEITPVIPVHHPKQPAAVRRTALNATVPKSGAGAPKPPKSAASSPARSNYTEATSASEAQSDELEIIDLVGDDKSEISIQVIDDEETQATGDEDETLATGDEDQELEMDGEELELDIAEEELVFDGEEDVVKVEDEEEMDELELDGADDTEESEFGMEIDDDGVDEIISMGTPQTAASEGEPEEELELDNLGEEENDAEIIVIDDPEENDVMELDLDSDEPQGGTSADDESDTIVSSGAKTKKVVSGSRRSSGGFMSRRPWS